MFWLDYKCKIVKDRNDYHVLFLESVHCTCAGITLPVTQWNRSRRKVGQPLSPQKRREH